MTKADYFKRVVAELNLDTRDPFTLLLANACALVDHRDALALAVVELIKRTERKAQALADDPENGYVEGDTNAFIWTNSEAEWQNILLDELAEEFRAYSAPLLRELGEDA